MSVYGLHPKAAAAPRVNAEDAVQSLWQLRLPAQD